MTDYAKVKNKEQKSGIQISRTSIRAHKNML